MATEAVRLLLTGASGQLGFELARALSVLGEVAALDRRGCDLADPAAIDRALAHYRPQVIVNAAAWTAVDRAEAAPADALAVNGTAPGQLARWAASAGALMVHYSTDYVFDGSKPGPYREDDEPAPLSAYGASKLAGERAVADACRQHLIFRTSWVYGAHGANFLKTVLRLARERRQLSMVADQVGAPTAASLIADVTAQVLAQYLRRSPGSDFPYGLYHLAAAGEASWHQYACYVVQQAAALGAQLSLDAGAIAPIPAAAYPLPAARPANSRLDTARLQAAFGVHLPSWQAGVDQVLQLLV